MVKIVQKGHPVLQKVAAEVTKNDFGSPELLKILDDMREALESQNDGVALAAPQIAISKRIFIVSPKVFNGDTENIPLVFINPEIIARSKDRKKMDEGCLSVRPWYGKTRRASRTTVEAFDEHGNKFQLQGKGLLSQIFQHEIEHLDGILFDDHAFDLKKLDEIDN